MNWSELETFIVKFRNLWKAGLDARRAAARGEQFLQADRAEDNTRHFEAEEVPRNAAESEVNENAVKLTNQ